MKIYLSGPMSGICDADGKPNGNFPAFNDAARQLRELGHDVVNPAELNPLGTPWTECMRKDIAMLVTCEAVVWLSGWASSPGARLEVYIAEKLGMPICSMEYMMKFNLAAMLKWAKPIEPVGHP